MSVVCKEGEGGWGKGTYGGHEEAEEAAHAEAHDTGHDGLAVARFHCALDLHHGEYVSKSDVCG